MSSNIYTDLNTYNPQKQPILVDIAALYQAIDNLVHTNKGERLFRPDYGLNIDETLFELIDNVTDAQILRDVINTIRTNEPRVEVDTRHCEIVKDPDNNTYKIYITFSLKEFRNQIFKFETTL